MQYEQKSYSDLWGTPIDFFKELDKEFNFTLDPCGNDKRLLKKDILTLFEKDNGLLSDWKGHRVFCNPPWSNGKMWQWIRKSYFSRNITGVIVVLIPVRTDRKAFHNYVLDKCEMRFIQGRLKFEDILTGKSGTARSPTMLCIYRPDGTVSEFK